MHCQTNKNITTMKQVSKEVLNKFTTEDLKHIVNEFFNSNGINFDFVQEVLSYKSIDNVELFYREFLIEKIREDVSFEELVESGWCFEDEMDD